MAEQFNPLDPLGIFGQVKKDVDRITAQAKLPPLEVAEVKGVVSLAVAK